MVCILGISRFDKIDKRPGFSYLKRGSPGLGKGGRPAIKFEWGQKWC